MDRSFTRYKNVSKSFFSFVTIHAFDRQTDESPIDIARLHSCSAVKMSFKHVTSDSVSIHFGRYKTFTSAASFAISALSAAIERRIGVPQQRRQQGVPQKGSAYGTDFIHLYYALYGSNIHIVVIYSGFMAASCDVNGRMILAA